MHSLPSSRSGGTFAPNKSTSGFRTPAPQGSQSGTVKSGKSMRHRQAHHVVDATVHFDNGLAARLLMQPVDVLCDQRLDSAFAL